MLGDDFINMFRKNEGLDLTNLFKVTPKSETMGRKDMFLQATFNPKVYDIALYGLSGVIGFAANGMNGALECAGTAYLLHTGLKNTACQTNISPAYKSAVLDTKEPLWNHSASRVLRTDIPNAANNIYRKLRNQENEPVFGKSSQ